MEKNLIKQILKQRMEQQRIIVIFEMLCLILALLLTITFFGDVPKKGVVICIVMAFVAMYGLLRWKRRKEIAGIIRLLESDIEFWENQKREYLELQEELEEKAEKGGKELNFTWFFRKISRIEREIQDDESWIEKFERLRWI